MTVEARDEAVSSRRAVLTGGLLGGFVGGPAALLNTAQAQNAAGALQAVFNVRDYGALGDGIQDDSKFIQAALDAASAVRHGIVYLPPPAVSYAYVIKKPLIVRGPISIVGPGPGATTIMAIGFEPGQFMLDFDCELRNTVQQIFLSGFTLRCENRCATGIRLKNAAYVLVKHLVAYGLRDGIYLTGKGTYSISFEQFIGYDTARYTVFFNGASGGFYSFVSSTFAGKAGVYIDSASGLNGVGFVNCNFEQCETNSFHAEGDVFGLSFSGCRTEGCDGDDFRISPVLNKTVAGLSITGCHFASDSGASRPIVLGGAGGRVSGFNICGNYVGYAGNTFVHLNDGGSTGVVAGNFLSGASMKATNVRGTNVHAFGNGNSSGMRSGRGR